MTEKPLKAQHKSAASPSNRDFRAVLQALARTRSSIVTVFSDFCVMVACCLAMQTREEEYLAVAKNYSRDELNQFAKAMAFLTEEMEDNPYVDVLGRYYADSVASADQTARGEFYTPHAISLLVARVSMDVDQIQKDKRIITVSDSACGSGGMILACGEAFAPHQDLMRATLQDINPTACHMAYINTTLWNIPAEVILGNTLKAECRARWANVHWYRMGEDGRRLAMRMDEALQEMFTDQEPKPPAKTSLTVPKPNGRDIQLELF